MREVRKSYREVLDWRAYQPFFPPELRCEGERIPEEEWWTWRGRSIHLDRHLAPEARLKLIFLHGGGGYGRMFAPFGIAARAMGAETVAPDLPGYGLSRDGGPYTFGDWIDCAVELVEAEAARDRRPLVVFGGSIGGMLAYCAGVRSPHVRAVIATCLFDASDPEAHPHIARTAWMGRNLRALMRVMAPFEKLSLPIKWLGKMSAIVNDPKLAAVCMADRYGGGNSVPIGFIRSFVSTPLPPPESFTRCPVLLVHGTDDRWTPLSLSQKFFDRLPGEKELLLLEGVGHFASKPDEFEAMRAGIAAFLARIFPS